MIDVEIRPTEILAISFNLNAPESDGSMSGKPWNPFARNDERDVSVWHRPPERENERIFAFIVRYGQGARFPCVFLFRPSNGGVVGGLGELNGVGRAVSSIRVARGRDSPRLTRGASRRLGAHRGFDEEHIVRDLYLRFLPGLEAVYVRRGMIEGKNTNFKATRANDRRHVLRIPIVLGFVKYTNRAS